MRLTIKSLACLKLAVLATALMTSTASHSEQITLKPLSFQSDIGWIGYQLPNVEIKNQTEANHPIWQSLTVPLIKQISLNVARLLYDKVESAPQLPSLGIILSEFEGVAFKEGDFNGATIKISRGYLAKFEKSHHQAALVDEIVGILYHEIAHAYQLDDHNYAEIGPVIEGIADVVRMQAGYIDVSHRKAGGHYDAGYKTTAFYFDWLIKQHPHISLPVINEQLNPHDNIKWSWQTFADSNQLILNSSWQQYQQHIL
ncbi:basic secretory protein-like protein [Pseudoalteromonas ulvae]|uniref:Secretion protein n=1 Tax=Pseudoalteromonas ulvae TaxID=107327 RepID=A0A244CR99_PSEDV|nr:basic secretory protein-like protein [Pseudoalteromonas ulvae]OUL58098.1 secretion protein [Pseudoalteromonas ulvae]